MRAGKQKTADIAGNWTNIMGKALKNYSFRYKIHWLIMSPTTFNFIFCKFK